MRNIIPQKAFSPQCLFCYANSWKSWKLIRKAHDKKISVMAVMLILPLNTLEICSPSAPWCQQKFRWVSGEMASLSTSFYQLVIPTMEMLLMRSRQCPRTIFLEAEVRKPRAQEASVWCILGRSRRTDISPDFAVSEGLKLILFAFQLPTFGHVKFWNTEHLGLKNKLKVTRIKGKKFFSTPEAVQWPPWSIVHSLN